MPRSDMDLRLFPYTPERDVYRLLQVDPAAGASEVLAACRRLSRTFHPDRNTSPRATQEMAVVNAVRSLMADPVARARYDTERWRWWQAARAPAHRPSPITAATLTQPAPPPPLERYARATWAGFRAALAALAPPRCARCRTIIAAEDAFCAACGGRLLETGRQGASQA